MKKKTISAIMTGLIISLSIMIIMLIYFIEKRGARTVTEDVSPIDLITAEGTTIQETDVASAGSTAEETIEERTIVVATPNATSSVNVRSGPGTDYSRIGSAYPQSEYEVVEILDNGWTHILYEGEEGYISSNYVDYSVQQLLDAAGNPVYEPIDPDTALALLKGETPGVSENEAEEPVGDNEPVD